MSSTSVSTFCRDVEPLLVMAQDPVRAAAAKNAIVDRIAHIPKLRAQRAAAWIVRRVWPGFRHV